MPAYAYAIKIDYNKKEIITEEKIEAPGLMDIKTLENIVGGNSFYFMTETDDTPFQQEINYIVIYKKRLETDEEQKKRIESEESYMREYLKRKGNK